ncbi:MAG: dephospho-CoA kinase [Deltaproteobacteria bacterium RBG_16_71_12]|nr:MAG: dephospho-CoA kinase [Deltaproteobacteria bacterium RBG_16_71_12]
MKLIGLTGGIAAGKSAVARMLAAAGVPVVDADLLAREVVVPGSDGLRAVAARFGDGVLTADGGLDRKKLGAIVFGDAAARRDLNAIVHPAVARLALERLEALRQSGAPVAVYEVPLLFENDLDAAMDATLLVAAPEDVQLRRLASRDGLDDDAARARLAAQLPQDEKRRRATATVENDGTLAELAARLRVAWRALTGDDVAFRIPSNGA